MSGCSLASSVPASTKPTQVDAAAGRKRQGTFGLQARADQEIRSARIEMRADARVSLEAIRNRFNAQAPRRLSLGAALEKIIAAYDEKTRPPVARKRFARPRQETGPEGDLLAGLGSDEPSR
jgi:hypothetical protein